jgi:hypothetical protein
MTFKKFLNSKKVDEVGKQFITEILEESVEDYRIDTDEDDYFDEPVLRLRMKSGEWYDETNRSEVLVHSNGDVSTEGIYYIPVMRFLAFWEKHGIEFVPRKAKG